MGDDENFAAFDGPNYTVDYVDTETFRLFHEYIYSRKITLPFHNVYHRDDTESTDSPDYSELCGQQNLRLVKLWDLVRLFQINDLQNHVVDNMMRVMEGCGLLNPECFDFVYENTKPGSALRKLIGDVACWVSAQETYYETNLNGFSNKILAEIAKTFHKATSDNRRFKDETLQKVALENGQPKDEIFEKIASDNGQPKDEPTISIRAWYEQEMVGSNYYVECVGQGMFKFTTEWSQANSSTRT
jgi:hypothetical protein